MAGEGAVPEWVLFVRGAGACGWKRTSGRSWYLDAEKDPQFVPQGADCFRMARKKRFDGWITSTAGLLSHDLLDPHLALVWSLFHTAGSLRCLRPRTRWVSPSPMNTSTGTLKTVGTVVLSGP